MINSESTIDGRGRDSPLPQELSEGNVVTAAAGRMLNGFQWLGNRTWKRRHPTRRDYVHLLAVRHTQLKEDSFLIRRSLSFGLLLFCHVPCLFLDVFKRGLCIDAVLAYGACGLMHVVAGISCYIADDLHPPG